MDHLFSGILHEAYVLVYIGEFLTAKELSKCSSVCKSLHIAFKNELLWSSLLKLHGMKQTNNSRTRTRNFQLNKTIYIDNACMECSEPSSVIFNINNISSSNNIKVPLCATCVMLVGQYDSVSTRKNANIFKRCQLKLGNMRRNTTTSSSSIGFSLLLELFHVIPVKKDLLSKMNTTTSSSTSSSSSNRRKKKNINISSSVAVGSSSSSSITSSSSSRFDNDHLLRKILKRAATTTTSITKKQEKKKKEKKKKSEEEEEE